MYIYICPASEVEITMMKLGEISGFLPYIDIYMKNNIYNYWFYHLKPYFNFYNHILFYFIVTLNSGHYRFRDPVLNQKLKLHPSWPWPWLTLMTHLVNWIWSAMFDAMRVNMLAWPMQSMLSIPWELGTDHSSSHGQISSYTDEERTPMSLNTLQEYNTGIIQHPSCKIFFSICLWWKKTMNID